MEGFLGKFSIYDFFNLLGSGLIFLIGLLTMGVISISDYINLFPESTAIEWLSLIVFLGCCYLIGIVFQQLSSITFERKFTNKVTSTILCENHTVLDNHLKLEVHRHKAKSLFERKGIELAGPCFSAQHCNYYFAYCSYYIQNHNNHYKAEKMRGLRGMYALLITCFFVLIFVSICRIGWCLANSEPIHFQLYCFGSFLLFFVICIRAYKENVQSWVKMVLGIYEVCDDISML